MTEEPEKKVDDMEQREKELDHNIEQAEKQWESTKEKLPSADDDEES